MKISKWEKGEYQTDWTVVHISSHEGDAFCHCNETVITM